MCLVCGVTMALFHPCYSIWIGAFTESEGCEYICEALRVNTTLRKLILSSNGIDDFGVKALADSLTVNATLHTLVRFFVFFFRLFYLNYED